MELKVLHTTIIDPALFIVIISVLGPVIGSAIGILNKPSFGYICNMLCFAAGVMLAISFLELIPESIHMSSVGTCVMGVICGSLVMYALDRLIPHIHPKDWKDWESHSHIKLKAGMVEPIAFRSLLSSHL